MIFTAAIRAAGAPQVVSRTSKLTYMWKGMAHLPALLQRLVKEEDQGELVTISCCHLWPGWHSGRCSDVRDCKQCGLAQQEG